jgi:hypothetical protein
MRPAVLALLLGVAAPAVSRGATPTAAPTATAIPIATPTPTPTATPTATATPAATPTAAPTPTAPAQGPDLELHVPRAEVKKVDLEVENLQARLDLDTHVANLVQINAGVVATVQKLKVQLEGVTAETHLVVRLERVTDVMARALTSIDRHPDLAGAAGVAAVAAGATTDAAPAAAAKPAAAPPENRTGVTP